MSQSVNSNEKTLLAGEDLSAKQYYIVQLDASGDIEVGEGATDLLVGVLQTTPESGQAGRYRFAGTSKVILGDTVAIGDWLTTNNVGKAVATTTDGDITIGRALEAGVVGDIVEAQLSVQHLYIA